MAMSATYASFGGRMVKESRGGAVKRYVADALGSVAKLEDASGTVTDSFEYWPYGEERTRTGATATPFAFVGTLGCTAQDLEQCVKDVFKRHAIR